MGLCLADREMKYKSKNPRVETSDFFAVTDLEVPIECACKTSGVSFETIIIEIKKFFKCQNTVAKEIV